MCFKKTRQLLLVSMTGALFGCSGTIFKTASMDNGESFFVDARQRVISNIKIDDKQYDGGQITQKRIVCAEPSPDLALAMAHSLGGGVSVFGYGSGNLSTATSQALSQLAERFAAVQLLRDILYRSCEAYSNGAISSTTYALMMARLDETTTTLLLGEMAAGAFGRQLGSGQASAESKTTTSLTEARNTPLRTFQTGNGAPATVTGGATPAPAAATQAATREMQSSTESDLKTTASVPTGLGAIAGRSPAGDGAAEVARIHKAFLDDDNLDALLVACITSLSHEGVKDGKSGTETSLGHICKTQIFNDFIENAKGILAAKANAEVLVSRARSEAGYVESLAKCLDAFKNDAMQCAPLITALSGFGAASKLTPASVKQ